MKKMEFFVAIEVDAKDSGKKGKAASANEDSLRPAGFACEL